MTYLNLYSQKKAKKGLEFIFYTCVDLCLRRVLHTFMLDDVVRNLAANQRLDIHPLQGHHRARRLQVRGEAQTNGAT